MAIPGPTTQRAIESMASSLLQLTRLERGWTQRQLAQAAGVPHSTVARIESGTRQPTLVTLARLLAAADLEMRIHLAPYDDHDDALDARYAAMSQAERAATDDDFTRTTQALAASHQADNAARQVRAEAPVGAPAGAPA